MNAQIYLWISVWLLTTLALSVPFQTLLAAHIPAILQAMTPAATSPMIAPTLTR